MDPWLIIDSHYLCHRAFHTMHDLSWNQRPTGVIFGFLKTIGLLKDEFQTDNVAFCFEHNELHRRRIFPEYKLKRHQELKPEEKKARKELHRQIQLLRSTYLPKIGFNNIFCEFGYESDDLMAAIAAEYDHEMILITADSDLYQCLRENVSMYSPQKQKIFTEAKFYSEYRIKPSKWAVVKALAGCASDGVPGIGGCGEISALKHIRGEKKLAITPEIKAIVRRNRKLVQLPFEGCVAPDLVEDSISTKGWKEVCAELGMKSLAQRPPIATHNLVKYAKSRKRV